MPRSEGLPSPAIEGIRPTEQPLLKLNGEPALASSATLPVSTVKVRLPIWVSNTRWLGESLMRNQ